jgi:hypothetical protein
VELLLGDFFQRDELVNACVIDQDVDLAERLLCFREQFLDFPLLRDVALDGDRLSTTLANFVDHAICALLRRCVIDYYRCAFRAELFCDACPNSFRRARYYCNFSV